MCCYWHLLFFTRFNEVNSLGVETDHTTGEAWPPALLDSLRRGTAAILVHIGKGADAVHFHSTICDPPGRKIDPAGLGLSVERARVAAIIAPHPTPLPKPAVKAAPKPAPRPAPRPAPKPVVSLSRLQRVAGVASWSRGLSPEAKADVVVLRKALDAEGVASYRAWQLKCGYSGIDADGIPGEASLKRLADRHGFEVAA